MYLTHLRCLISVWIILLFLTITGWASDCKFDKKAYDAKNWEKVLSACPSSSGARYNYAIQLWKNGEKEKAREQVDIGLEGKLLKFEFERLFRVFNRVDWHFSSFGKDKRTVVFLIIGNQDYQDEDISDLRYSINDANAMEQLAVQGFRSYQITKLSDVTQLNFEDVVENEFPKRVKKAQDVHPGKEWTVIFYYSGHGLPGKDRQALLLPVDASISKGGIKRSWVEDTLLANIPGARVVMILDACFTGKGKNGEQLVANAEGTKKVGRRPDPAKEPEQKQRITVISASQHDEVSWEYEEKQHGMMTYFLLKTIQDGVSGGELELIKIRDVLRKRLFDTLKKENKVPQVPQVYGDQTLRLFN